MSVVRVLVEAEVRDHDGVVAHLPLEGPEPQLGDPLRIVGRGSLGVLRGRDAEQHEGPDAPGRDVDGLLAERLDRVLDVAGHRGDRRGLVDPLLHEQRRNEVPGRELRLANEAPERLPGGISSRTAPLQQFPIARIRPNHIIVIGHEEMIQQKQAVFFRQAVRRYARGIEVLIGGAAFGVGLELDQ